MKRRGFTLIELMVVIAIIIILAAIAIPNYLSMTARAKKSRVASDFNAIATALESYKTDWGSYPTVRGSITTTAAVTDIYSQIAGADTATALSGTLYNWTGAQTMAGDKGPIAYMTTNILSSMKNPYTNANDYEYITGETGGTAAGLDWVLFAADSVADAALTAPIGYSRTDITATLSGPAIALVTGH